MFPFDFDTIQSIKTNHPIIYIYGPDPIEYRWGWTVEHYYDTGLVYETQEEAERDCQTYLNAAKEIPINLFDKHQ